MDVQVEYESERTSGISGGEWITLLVVALVVAIVVYRFVSSRR
jgi:hypothetical protein